jgi:hypothetical protein
MEIIGYKYETEAEALQVVDALNKYWQLPKPNGQSEFNMSMFNTLGGGYWIRENKEWYEPVLGQPYNFEIQDAPKLM